MNGDRKTAEPSFASKIVHAFRHRLVKPFAESFGFSVYEPIYTYKKLLEEQTNFTLSDKRIRDKRPTTANQGGLDLTLTVEGLEDVIPVERFRGKRILEIGPKYGIHSRWIDKNLSPSELVFCDFASDVDIHKKWEGELTSKHRWVYGDLRSADELLTLEPFDLVFFMGIMYHSSYHIQLLSMLNKVTKPGGTMFLETSYDWRPDAVVRIYWQPNTGKAKAVPSLDALRIMLAWTGWRTVCRYTDYRPGSTELLISCEKTDELELDSDFCGKVRPHRPKAAAR